MPTSSVPTSDIQAIGRLDTACRALATVRNRPMLVMFYPPGAVLTEMDVRDVYGELRRGGATKEQKLANLDMLLHTYGGDPVTGYRVAQVCRSMTKRLEVLIPEHAYSAGTLMSFAGDNVKMGDFAGLSPIDITLADPEAATEGVQLAGVDSFLDFARGAREKMEQFLKRLDRDKAHSNVDSDLLVQMVKEIGALTVGKYYRERTLTGRYAEMLLQSYMFKGETDCKSRTGNVIAHFLFGAPSHDFHLDYQLCKEWHLKVSEMSTDESDLSKVVVKELRTCTDKGIICHRLNARVRMPFITFYKPSSRRKRNASSRASQQQARRTRNSQKASGNV